MKKEYIEPQVEVIDDKVQQLMQQVSVNPDAPTNNNDSLELGFEEE